ncbi:MAG: hypothetical protein D4R45_04310, partial [Planctomycetaceae bacterium]
MDMGKKNKAFSARGETVLSPWLFRHRDLINRIESSPKAGQRELINTLNHIHFMDGHVFFYLNHPKYEEGILLKASLEPCMGDEVTCRWLDEMPPELKLEDYQIRYLVIIDGQS